jgi:DNA-binding HxlR family transcriptional regulator
MLSNLRSDLPSAPYCPFFQRLLELIGRRWTASILRVLLARPSRFGEIVASVPGLSHRLLSQRLGELEENHMIEVSNGVYGLTARGRDLEPLFVAADNWNRRWVSQAAE